MGCDTPDILFPAQLAGLPRAQLDVQCLRRSLVPIVFIIGQSHVTSGLWLGLAARYAAGRGKFTPCSLFPVGAQAALARGRACRASCW